MTDIETWRNALLGGAADSILADLYGSRTSTLLAQKQRWLALLDQFAAAFPNSGEVAFYSAPGRTEVGGNHTDHNGGRVLAAAVDLDMLAVAAPNQSGLVRIHSQGYPPIKLRLDDAASRPAEREHSIALVRGMCARIQQLDFAAGGFDAVVDGAVPKGSGLSSSAAYEMLIGAILNRLYNASRLTPIQVAQIGQWAENEYFGKPSGGMDQTSSAVGGFVAIDFADPANPQVTHIDLVFRSLGYQVVIVNTGGSHADLTADYAAIREEMEGVARHLGGQRLRDVPEERFMAAIPELRARTGDRALLRALHYFGENARVLEQVSALQNGDMPAFLALVNASGSSSWRMNQNVYSLSRPAEQGVSLGLALAEKFLEGQGAFRVHGGGFAGTMQAFVPDGRVPAFLAHMEAVFGQGSCHPVSIRSRGAGVVDLPG